MSLETARDRIRLQKYIFSSTYRQKLGRIYALDVDFLLNLDILCRIFSNFVAAIHNKVKFMADKPEKMSTGHVSTPNSSVKPTK